MSLIILLTYQLIFIIHFADLSGEGGFMTMVSTGISSDMDHTSSNLFII